MDFSRRLRLYLLGVLIGGVMAWFFFGQRLLNGGWTPEARVKLRLKSTLTRATPPAEEQLRTAGFTLEALRNAMTDPDMDVTDIRRSTDSMYYTLTGTVQQKKAILSVSVLRDYRTDSTATLLEVKGR